MWIRSFLFVLMSMTSILAAAQNADPISVANEYFYQGDYEKAQKEYEQLLRNRRNIPLIHDNYVSLLMRQKQFDIAEDHINKAIKYYPTNFTYEIDLGLVYAAKGDSIKADQTYNEVIEKVSVEARQENNANKVRIMAQEFYDKNLRTYSIQSYQSGRRQFNRPDLFSLELANVYRVLNEKANMINEYLLFTRTQPGNVNYIKNTFQRLLTEPTDLDTLEIALYDFIQTDMGNPVYNDLLIWTHLQQKNFSAALRQARALDRRLQNEGKNTINVGLISYRNEDYRTADKAFAYIIEDFPESPNMRLAKRYALLAKEEVIKSTYPVDTIAIQSLIKDYEEYQKESRDIISIMEAKRRVALLQAFQLNDIESAIETLLEITQQPVG
jgi:predicted Zn-dependent protease